MKNDDIKIAIIAAMDAKGCIGKAGKLPWHKPADLKRFKEKTTGGTVIMGRKTFDSLGRKTLPDRWNLVVGTTMVRGDYYRDTVGLLYCESINEAIVTARYYAKKNADKTIWIIGGAEIYRQTIDQADVLELTRFHDTVEDGDAFFPDTPGDFEIVATEEHEDMDFITYERKATT